MEPAAQHNTSALAGWTDRLDRPLYEHAVGLFRAGLRRHGVSREACRQQVCPCCPAAFPLDGSVPVPVMDVVGLARLAAPRGRGAEVSPVAGARRPRQPWPPLRTASGAAGKARLQA
ncbi:unnamed protein product [Prorocentrum cordatum]|uniref:RING-type E3 ubiquitin transferase n=1 Tax=Prorocentrum cordatum TaxID=2364126 RepID=A0ABN9RJP0_9DINO|nr:unnamed protein product [Polarella glacialis]